MRSKLFSSAAETTSTDIADDSIAGANDRLEHEIVRSRSHESAETLPTNENRSLLVVASAVADGVSRHGKQQFVQIRFDSHLRLDVGRRAERTQIRSEEATRNRTIPRRTRARRGNHQQTHSIRSHRSEHHLDLDQVLRPSPPQTSSTFSPSYLSSILFLRRSTTKFHCLDRTKNYSSSSNY